MRAMVLRAHGPVGTGVLHAEDRPVPEPGPGEVLLHDRLLLGEREIRSVTASTRQDAAEFLRTAGADVVFECTGRPDCVNATVPLCRPDGAFVWQGNYGTAPVPFAFLPAHGRRLRMHFPCDDGLAPCRRAVVANMARGALRWEETITHRVDHADAPGLVDRVNRGTEPDAIGLVIRWHPR